MKLQLLGKYCATSGVAAPVVLLAGFLALACSDEPEDSAEDSPSSPDANSASGGANATTNPPQGTPDATGGSAQNQPGEGTGAQSATGGAPGLASGNCKRGVPFDRWVEPLPTGGDLAALSPATFWFYNWTAHPHPSLDYLSQDYDFVPMIKDGDFDADTLIASLPSDANALLGFNEPMIFEAQGGVNMSLDQVLARWPDVEKVATARDLTLVSPALTFANNGGLNGPEFMQAFFERCPECRVDAIAMHTYTCEVEWVRDHIEPYREFGLPIWVTEFACFDEDPERVKRFMRETVEFFEGDDDIARYAWFMGRAESVGLLDGAGQPTELGELYVSLPYDNGCVRTPD